MGYRHKISKDKLHRQFFLKNELNVIMLHYFSTLPNSQIDHFKKSLYFFKFIRRYHLNSSRSRIVNRCLYSGKSSWILRQFRMSRMTFKEFAEHGKLNGVRRAIW